MSDKNRGLPLTTAAALSLLNNNLQAEKAFTSALATHNEGAVAKAVTAFNADYAQRSENPEEFGEPVGAVGRHQILVDNRPLIIGAATRAKEIARLTRAQDADMTVLQEADLDIRQLDPVPEFNPESGDVRPVDDYVVAIRR